MIYQKLTLLSILTFLLTSAVPLPRWQTKVDPSLLQSAVPAETEFLVVLTEQADLSQAARLKTKAEKGAYVYRTLLETAVRSQSPLRAALQRMGVEYRPYYIVNMLWVRGDASVIQMLALRSDVASLEANPSVRLKLPEPEAGAAALVPETVDTIEWNVLQVNADDVWAMGYTGQGVVVGGQDTGYDWDHPALINHYRGWNGVIADHNYNWHDAIHNDNPLSTTLQSCGFNLAVPCDDGDHGTHTMGSMVGSDGGTNQIGVAPGAKWIGCRNMEEGWGTPASYAECYEWFIAPYPIGGAPEQGDPSKAPDVINNSWSCPPEEGCTDPFVLKKVVDNVRAAGILSVHSAGNYGSACSTVDAPAGIYDSSFTVGATDSSDNIASFSSRGAVMVDGSYRLKPDISAPGYNVRSSIPPNLYSTKSGTSMAAPQVAGVAALLMSVDPTLRGDMPRLEALLTQNALPRTSSQTCNGVPGSMVPNNTYGWGRVDALSAALSIPDHLLSVEAASRGAIRPGDVLTYTLSVNHYHANEIATSLILTNTLPALTTLEWADQGYTLLGNDLRWELGNLAAGDSKQVKFAVRASESISGILINLNYAVDSLETDVVVGTPYTVPVVIPRMLLPFVAR